MELATSEKLECWQWLADRDNHASVHIKYRTTNHSYEGHRVTWYADGFGWCSAEGKSLEAAIKSAMTTTFRGSEYFPGKVE
ncbi:hypothetical protein D3C80_873280 [compost metagenome]